MRTVKGLAIYMIFAVIAVLMIVFLPWDKISIGDILVIVAVFIAVVSFVFGKFISECFLKVIAVILIGLVIVAKIVIPLLTN